MYNKEQSFRASLEFAPSPPHLKKITPNPPTDFKNATVPQCRSFQVSILTISWTTQTIYTPGKDKGCRNEETADPFSQ